MSQSAVGSAQMARGLDLVQGKQPRFTPIVERALSLAVLEHDDLATRHAKRLVVGALWVSLLAPWPAVLEMVTADAPLAALATGATAAPSAIVLVAFWLRPSSYPSAFHILLGANFALTAVITLLFGGFLQSGGNFVWALPLLVGALAVFADWRAVAWLIVAVVTLVGSSVAAQFVEPRYEYPNPEFGAVLNFLIVLLFAFFVLFYYVRQRVQLLDLSDGLLENILPRVIAERLKLSDETIADEYEATSILFADVAGFTPMSAEMTPSELVGLLDEVFSDFDAMVDSRGLEKIKTIGDAYMVASGIPVPRADHAEALCELALEMRDHARGRAYGGRQIEFRIGINSGPVVAGIIGTRKFSYDLWGDSVNTASRMESFGRPGRIQITEATLKLIEDEFVCEPGGSLDVKGKGPMPVWFLEGRR